MTSRIVVVGTAREMPEGRRGETRDGWRVFRSQETGFELAVPAYQVRRIEEVGKRERNEWYALAVGELRRDESGTHAVIRDFVPNDWAEHGRAHVHMGADAEGRVRELARELHPGLRPLGNVHTHPRYTTKPSGTDRKEFWNDPNSVSIIVDPFDEPSIAVYRGRDGERLMELSARPTDSHVPAALPRTSAAESRARRRFFAPAGRILFRSGIAMTALALLAWPSLLLGKRIEALSGAVRELGGQLKRTSPATPIAQVAPPKEPALACVVPER